MTDDVNALLREAESTLKIGREYARVLCETMEIARNDPAVAAVAGNIEKIDATLARIRAVLGED